MLIMKKNILFFILLIFFNLQNVFGEQQTAKYIEEDCEVYIIFNDAFTPGNPNFVRMRIETPKNIKSSQEYNKTAVLRLLLNDKSVEKCSFYKPPKTLPSKNKKYQTTELLAATAGSPWYGKGNYTLKITFTFAENQEREILLPLTYTPRKWNEEIIYLDESNTAIKTDNSKQRQQQIEKLNEILYTQNTEDVFTCEKYICPTTSTRYTSWFGDRRVYQYSNGKSSTSLHYGNDYGIPEGSEVRACATGKVVLAEWRNSTGWSIVIEHLPGLYSLYYHLSEMKVKEGDMVSKNDLIALSGKTGLATGPHLHWEMRLNGNAVMPEFFFENYSFEDIEY